MLAPASIAAFVKEATAIQTEDGGNTPPDYVATRAAVMVKLGIAVQASPLARAGQWAGRNAGHLTEVAGLGILAKPSIDEMRGKKVPEKSKARTELAGLGTLAAPSAYHLLTHR